MNKITKLILAIVVALAGVANVSAPVFADESEESETPATWLQVSPTALTVTLMSGDIISGQSSKCPEALDGGCIIEIKNLGTESFRYRVYASPYSVTGKDEVNFSDSASTSFTQISRWLSFLGSDGEYHDEVIYEIAPGETQTVGYRIEVPEDVPGGAQYAVIWAQTLSNGSAGGTGVQTLSQAGVVVSGRSIGNTVQQAEVTDYNFTRFALGGSLTAHANIKNTGNTDFDAYYSYTARTLFGKELYTDNGSIPTFPGVDYDIDLSWDNTPFLGIFTVEFKISGANLDKSETHIVMIMPVFVMVLLILLLTVVIIWIIIIIRKRKERKARTLVQWISRTASSRNTIASSILRDGKLLQIQTKTN